MKTLTTSGYFTRSRIRISILWLTKVVPWLNGLILFPQPCVIVMAAPQREMVNLNYAFEKADSQWQWQPVILKSNTVTRFNNFWIFDHHSRLTEQFTESQVTSWISQQAYWRGFLEGSSKLVSVFIEANKNFNVDFLHNKIPKKNLKTIGAYTESTDLTFRTFKKLFTSWHNPFKARNWGKSFCKIVFSLVCRFIKHWSERN